MSNLIDDYLAYVEKLIDEKGISLNLGMALRRSDGGLEVYATDLPPEAWARFFWDQVGMQASGDVKSELVFGMDRNTMPGQGTEFADAFVFAHWTRRPGRKFSDQACFRVGVLNYQHEPRIVRAVDWENEHWTNWTLRFLRAHYPPFLMNFKLKDDPVPKAAVAIPELLDDKGVQWTRHDSHGLWFEVWSAGRTFMIDASPEDEPREGREGLIVVRDLATHRATKPTQIGKVRLDAPGCLTDLERMVS